MWTEYDVFAVGLGNAVGTAQEWRAADVLHLAGAWIEADGEDVEAAGGALVVHYGVAVVAEGRQSAVVGGGDMPAVEVLLAQHL